jgi:hypothetical protein
MMFSLLAVLYSSLETDRQPSFGGDAANVGEENNAAAARTAIDAQLGSAICSSFGLNSACATISDNTNSNAATNGQSLHTRRHSFAAKNPSRRSRTRSSTPHGTPPKEVPACCVKRKKKVPIRTLWSRRAKVLTQCYWSCGIGSLRRRIGLMFFRRPTPPAAPSPPSDHPCQAPP